MTENWGPGNFKALWFYLAVRALLEDGPKSVNARGGVRSIISSGPSLTPVAP